MEEGSEFVQRFMHHRGELPLITSCCPAWVDFMEKYHSDMIEHFSTCKSPHEIVGTLAKTYFAKKTQLDPKKIKVISIMPCTAKKFEITRSRDMFSSGFQDVDVSLTTRELARMIKQAGIDFEKLPDGDADSILGEYTGAGTIFGATGGVAEAAIRGAHYLITNEHLEDIELQDIRGLEGVKEATVMIGKSEVRIAVAHGMGHIETVLDRVRAAKEAGEEPPYHMIEVMACPGGCIGGGGQPYGITDEMRRQRAKGLYSDDRESKKRRSYENESVQLLYKDFLGKPLSETSHKLLHTSYKGKPTYQR
jgi:NADH-quinone oxidoreductase subunit G